MSSEVQRYITGIMTPVEMANPGPASISARQAVVVTYEDYAALEAECERLREALLAENGRLNKQLAQSDSHAGSMLDGCGMNGKQNTGEQLREMARLFGGSMPSRQTLLGALRRMGRYDSPATDTELDQLLAAGISADKERIKQLEARNAELEQDAARYRLVRRCNDYGSKLNPTICKVGEFDLAPRIGGDHDKEIYAALQQEAIQ